jgi:hypothetical protein
VPKHKAAEVSRGHSTSRFFFLREGLNIMVRSFTTRLGRWCKDSHTVFFFRDGTSAGGKDGIWR